MKKIIGFVTITVLFLLTSCASVPKTGFDKEKMSVVNMMGYSDDDLAIKFAKEIWNDKVSVVSIENEVDYKLSYNTADSNSFEIYVDPEKSGLDFSTELATLVCCVGYIRENTDNPDIVSDATAYAKKIYPLIVNNVLKNNPNVVFKDRADFEMYLKNLEITKVENSYYIK